jgi:hypothetical protein
MKICTMQPGAMSVPVNQWPTSEPELALYVGKKLASDFEPGWVRYTPWQIEEPLTPLRAPSVMHSRYKAGGAYADVRAEEFQNALLADEEGPGYCYSFPAGSIQNEGPTIRVVLEDARNGFLMIGDTTFIRNGT